MPRPIGVIQKPGLFEDLLSRFGINRPQAPFTLDGDVVPVIIVDSGVAFVAAPTPPYRVADIFTAGPQVAPAAGFVLADTGPLAVGSFTSQFVIAASEQNSFDVEFRNAGNTATIRAMRFRTTAESQLIQWESRFQIENVNERLRVINIAAGAVGQDYDAVILSRI